MLHNVLYGHTFFSNFNAIGLSSIKSVLNSSGISVKNFIVKLLKRLTYLKNWIQIEGEGTMYDCHDSTDIFVNLLFLFLLPKRLPELALKTVGILVPKVAY